MELVLRSFWKFPMLSYRRPKRKIRTSIMKITHTKFYRETIPLTIYEDAVFYCENTTREITFSMLTET